MIKNRSRFGLHIRLHDSLFDAASKVQRLGHRFFQTVLMLESRQFFNMTDDQVQKFIEFRRVHCDYVYAHGAYWSNLTHISGRGFHSLLKEVELAEKLEFTHLVIHPGSFLLDLSSDQRIDEISKAIEILLKHSSKIIFLLENSPHKDRSFSCDIVEFGKLFQKFKKNHRVKMCVDTAHAYVAGYDLISQKKVNEFVLLLEKHVGIENIGLLHCNDTKKSCGSFLDMHAVPGQGNIGMESLYAFVHHPKLVHIPVILEMPTLDESLEVDVIDQFENMEVL